ncbi:hypothetical protein PMAYCL1PPCAC_10055 [Pristionchus mayeri]|uniref:C-type lectin domain-containing protein n=1 Tax=Pristionchus mayeri TaxID=1317129 RepID=A0AAN5CCN4_9BILA|nr:hypothetical protein PMAYCL1PPCAC_10055 [Pristionchus mayeri]
MLLKAFPLLLLSLPFSIPSPRHRSRCQDRDDSEFSPCPLSRSDSDLPDPSLIELETRLTDAMRKMHSSLSSRLDKLEEALLGMQRSNEKGEWLERDDRSSYRLHEERRKWKEAQSICQSQGANLVTVDSAEENDFITKIVKTKPHIDFVWLKMKNRAKVTPLDAKYNNITFREHRRCTILCSDSTWDLRPCDQLRPFICKRDPPSPASEWTSEEEDVESEVALHPTLNKPIQPWKKAMESPSVDSQESNETLPEGGRSGHTSSDSPHEDGGGANKSTKRPQQFRFE